jgi:hypothetical protein
MTAHQFAALPIEHFAAWVRLLIAALPLLAALAAGILAVGYGGGLLVALAIQKMWGQE